MSDKFTQPHINEHEKDTKSNFDDSKLIQLEYKVSSLVQENDVIKNKLKKVVWVLTIALIIATGYAYFNRSKSILSGDGLYVAYVCDLDRDDCEVARVNVAKSVYKNEDYDRYQIFEVFLDKGSIYSFEECLYVDESCVDKNGSVNWSIHPLEKIGKYRKQ